MAKTLDEVARRFAALGAPKPEAWARSEIEEGGQLGRFLFLRQGWRQVIPDDDSWIPEALSRAAQRGPNGPGAALGPALNRLLEKVGPADITTVVRVMQWELFAALCYQLEDPDLQKEAPDIAWRLFQIDPDSGDPIEPIAALHESVLETDPTGREMRPRAD
jgi:hypothetical protein